MPIHHPFAYIAGLPFRVGLIVLTVVMSVFHFSFRLMAEVGSLLIDRVDLSPIHDADKK